MKVWDYYFRGSPTPYSQSFSMKEPVQFGFFTNDHNNSFICIGAESRGIYRWDFIVETYSNSECYERDPRVSKRSYEKIRIEEKRILELAKGR